MGHTPGRRGIRSRSVRTLSCVAATALFLAGAATGSDADERARKKCYCLYLDAEHKQEYCDRYRESENELCYGRCRCAEPYDREQQREMNKQEYEGALRDVRGCCTGCWKPLAGILALVVVILMNPHL